MRPALFFLLAFTSFQLFAQQAPKKVLVEKITSTGCPGCPLGSYILDSLAQNDTNIIVVAIHLNDFWHPDSLHSEDGDAVIDEYKWGTPTAMIDRVGWPSQNHVPVAYAFWKDLIDQRKAEVVQASIGANSSYDPNTRQLTVSVNGSSFWGFSSDTRLNVYLLEEPVSGSGVGYDQLNGYNNVQGNPLFGLGNPITNYQHKWVLRDMLGGPWGEPGSIAIPAAAGSAFQHTFTTTVSPDWNDSNLSLVALVQRYNADSSQRQILNAIQLGLNETVLASVDAPSVPQLSIWPIPSSGLLNVHLEGASEMSLSLVDLQGRKVKSSVLKGATGTMEIGFLPSGLYFLHLEDESGNHFTQKVILRN